MVVRNYPVVVAYIVLAAKVAYAREKGAPEPNYSVHFALTHNYATIPHVVQMITLCGERCLACWMPTCDLAKPASS